MKLTSIVINTLLLATFIIVANTSPAKQPKNQNPKKLKTIQDQEAQPSNNDKNARHKRGHHFVHLVKPVHKLKKLHVVVPKYHEEHHIEEHKPKEEEVHHSFSETHEHIHEGDEKLEKNYDLPKVEEYHHPIIEPIEEHKEKVKVKHHHHHHHHNHIKTVIKKVPEPYPVEKVVHVPVEKVVHVPVEKIVHVPKPYPVEKVVEKVVHVPVEKIVHVPKPYPVEKIVEKPIHIEKKIPVEVKVPYPVEKIVHVPVEKIVEKVIHVPVEKIIHVPKPYPIIKPVPYPVEVKVPIHIPRPVPYPVEKKIPIPIKVEKKIPVPVFISEHKHEEHEFQHIPISYSSSHEKDYSSLDSKIHPVQVHPRDSPSSSLQDQNSDQSANHPRHSTPINNSNNNNGQNVQHFLKIQIQQQQQEQQHRLQQQYTKDFNNVPHNPPFNYQAPPPGPNTNPNLHAAESNVIPISIVPPGAKVANNKQPFQIEVPDEQLPNPEPLVQEQSQQHPIFQAYPIQFVQIQPISSFQPNGITTN